MTSNPHSYLTGEYIDNNRQDECSKCGTIRLVERGKDYTRVVGYKSGEVEYDALNEPICKQVNKSI